MIETINKLNAFLTSKTMMVFDYVGAFFIIGFALYKYFNQQDYIFWAIAGAVSLIFAIIRPAKLIQERVLKQQLKRIG